MVWEGVKRKAEMRENLLQNIFANAKIYLKVKARLQTAHNVFCLNNIQKTHYPGREM